MQKEEGRMKKQIKLLKMIFVDARASAFCLLLSAF